MATESGGSRDVLRAVVPAGIRRRLWAAANELEVVQQRAFERRMGVATSGHVYLDDLGLSEVDRGFYEGCPWLPVRRALRSLAPGPADVLVDLGSGKGQALLIAGRLPFGRVLGVELSEELNEAARRNLAAAAPRLRAGSCEVLTSDVLAWPVPDDLSVVFLYCPFLGPLFHDAVERLLASYDRRPRPLHIVYAFPWEHDWLISTGRVVLVDLLPCQWPARPWWWRSSWVITVYRVVPPGGASPPARAAGRRRLFRPERAFARWSRPNGHVFRLARDGRVVLRSDGLPPD